MTPTFKYMIVMTTLDGNKSMSRFITASSAYSWASRLKNEGSEWLAYKIAGSKSIKLTLGELKKEAGPLKRSKSK